MIHLAEEFFDVKNDPAQLAITPEVMERLRRLHPCTLNEATDSNGPIAWVLIIPTAEVVMKKFLEFEITEGDLLEKTSPNVLFSTIYLCSALVLPEYRKKGLAKRLMVEAVEAIRKDHQITSLFYWSFSTEGETLATSVAKACGLPLLRREDKPRN